MFQALSHKIEQLMWVCLICFVKGLSYGSAPYFAPMYPLAEDMSQKSASEFLKKFFPNVPTSWRYVKFPWKWMLNSQESRRLDAKRHCVIWAKALGWYLASWSCLCSAVLRHVLYTTKFLVWDTRSFIKHPASDTCLSGNVPWQRKSSYTKPRIIKIAASNTCVSAWLLLHRVSKVSFLF